MSEHGFSPDVVRGWHIHRDAMASKNQHLANCSRFQLAWERTRNSMQAPLQLALAAGPASPPPVLGASVPPPGDGEADPESQEEMEAEPAPPSAAGSSTDGVLERRRWKQDVLASEDRLMARMDQLQNFKHQTVESLNAALQEGLARFKRSIMLFWRTSCRPTTLTVMAVLSLPTY